MRLNYGYNATQITSPEFTPQCEFPLEKVDKQENLSYNSANI